MEPIPYFFGSIDRNAILVRPQKPFYDWLKAVYPTDKDHDPKDECNIYLIHEMGSNAEVLEWVKENFDHLFANELNDWYTDEDRWPADRTYAMFAAWFSVELHSMILDLEEDPITKE